MTTHRDDKTDPRYRPPAHDDTDPGQTAVPRGRVNTRPVARFYPANPRTLEDTGLTSSQIEASILKALFFVTEMRGIDLARHLRLPTQIIEPMLEQLRRLKLIDIRGGSGQGFGLSTMIYALGTLAQEPLKQIFDHDRYNGPAPVPYHDWVTAVRAQSIRGVRVTHDMLSERLGGMHFPDELIDGLGPAINSGRSVFLHGPSGNGKTSLCRRIANCYSWDIYVPYAVDIDGYVVKVYDEMIHRQVTAREGDPATDERWVRCRRPLVVVGGELTMDMLDMAYSPEMKFYEAPLQMKASNGVLLIDDLGRQRITPRELLNRWIFPLENDVDYLKLDAGKRFAIPFDAFLVFSTNLDPKELVDDAFLRRVRYKIKLDAPPVQVYKEIFREQCEQRGLAYLDAEIDTFIRFMNESARPLAACQPRDLIDQINDHAFYRGERPAVTAETLSRAAQTYFAQFK